MCLENGVSYMHAHKIHGMANSGSDVISDTVHMHRTGCACMLELGRYCKAWLSYLIQFVYSFIVIPQTKRYIALAII